MKRSAIFIALFFIFSAASFAQTKPALTVYKDSAEKILFAYPAKWDTLKEPGMIFNCIDKTRDRIEGFRANISLYKFPTPEAVSYEKILSEAVGTFQKKNPTDSVIEKGLFKNAGGFPFALMKVKVKRNGVNIISAQLYFRRNKEIYVLGMANAASAVNLYASIFGAVVDNFRLLK